MSSSLSIPYRLLIGGIIDVPQPTASEVCLNILELKEKLNSEKLKWE